jgi:hypothetical protein
MYLYREMKSMPKIFPELRHEVMVDVALGGMDGRMRFAGNV